MFPRGQSDVDDLGEPSAQHSNLPFSTIMGRDYHGLPEKMKPTVGLTAFFLMWLKT
jgi:hypothetical protein